MYCSGDVSNGKVDKSLSGSHATDCIALVCQLCSMESHQETVRCTAFLAWHTQPTIDISGIDNSPVNDYAFGLSCPQTGRKNSSG